MMLKFSMENEAANQAIKSGQLTKVMMKLMEMVKPEAAYFGLSDGLRTGYVFFDLVENSDVPMIAEPLFMELGAELEIQPVMTPQEVQIGLEKAAKY
jgi:hypothetical protein